MSYTGRPNRVKGTLQAGVTGRAESCQDHPRLPWCRGHCPLWSQNGVLDSSLRGRIPQASALSDLSRASWTLLAAQGLACVFCDRSCRASTLGPGFHHPRPSLASAPRTSTSKTSLLRPELLRSISPLGPLLLPLPPLSSFGAKRRRSLRAHGTPQKRQPPLPHSPRERWNQ